MSTNEAPAAPGTDAKSTHEDVVESGRVKAQVERILASQEFANRERLKRFLRFVAEETLQGRGPQLNEYLLGQEVFDKDATFDPRTNPIVRVEAHRLRSRLVEYYREQGARDPLVIDLPKGSYSLTFRVSRTSPKSMLSRAAARFGRQWWTWATAAALLALTATIFFLASRRGARPGAPTPPQLSVAVLPFADLSLEKDQEYLCDGLTDELIATLAAVDGLRVVSRTSAFAFKGKQQDIRQIGRLLNADSILEGSLRKVGDRLRVTAQLTETQSGFEVWSQSFEQRVGDVLTFQDRIAQAIVNRLGVHLRAGRTRLPSGSQPQNAQAQRLYLMGRYQLNKRTAEGFKKAIAYFEEAIRLDKNSANAYAGLADAYYLLPGHGIASPQEAMPRMMEAASNALRMNDSLAEAHTTLACVRSSYDWDWKEADREFRRALQLSPSYAAAHHWYSGLLRNIGNFEESRREIELALSLDPLSPSIAADEGALYRAMRQHDRAIQKYLKVIEFEPQFHKAHLYLGIDYAAKGDFENAIRSLETARTLPGSTPHDVSWWGYCHARSGRSAKAHEALAQLDALSRQQYVSPMLRAIVYIGLGDLRSAFRWLETSLLSRDPMVASSLKVEPVFDPLRADPRFQSLLRRIGL